jgi:RimJ/RimL family protein N-acetyltransferase
VELRDSTLLLRPIQAGDADALVSELNDPSIARFMTLIPAPYTAGDAASWVERCNQVWKSGECFPFAITELGTGRLVGSIEIKSSGTIGYWIAADVRGRGYATMALRLVCAWQQQRPLQLTTHPANVASQRVAEKVGFRRVGPIIAELPFRDGEAEAILFQLD